MFSILDILKRHRDEKRKAPDAGTPASVPGAVPPPCPQRPSFMDDAPSLSIFSAVNKEQVEESVRQMAEVYEDGIALARAVYAAGGPDGGKLSSELEPFLSRLISLASQGNREFLKLFFADYPGIPEYPYCHVLNVCFLAVEFGLELRYEPQALMDLGKAAFLHDIGILNVMDLIMKPAKLTDEELAHVRQHPKTGAEILEKVCRDLPHRVVDVILGEHERFDGTGYPRGLKAEDIPEFAQIVGLADVYEALTHSRPYRVKMTPSTAFNTILNNKAAYNSRIIKALIERVGIFPVGSRVRLNTKEIAVVTAVNPASPLRPVVNVVVDAQGAALTNPKEINLCKNYLIYIEENQDR